MLLAGSVGAQVSGNRGLTLMVPFAAGAANDVLARILAPHLRESLGSVVVENRPGADGAIGAMAVLAAPHDGRTVLVVPDQMLISQAAGQPASFDFVRDFTPVVQTNHLPFFLVVNPAVLPAGSAPEAVRLLKASPGRYSYGSAGNASPHHLAMQMLVRAQGLDLVHVPYKGMGQGIPDLLAGRIQFVITGLPAVSAHLKDGRLRALATVGGQRSSLRPDLPTFAEQGIAGVRMDTWQGLFVPADTPRAMIEQINRAVNIALARADVREQMVAQGMDVAGGSPEAFAETVRSDLQRFRELLRGLTL
jgi:tripartite-type tricarboxylate transporter receptor subunit TctC